MIFILIRSEITQQLRRMNFEKQYALWQKKVPALFGIS